MDPGQSGRVLDKEITYPTNLTVTKEYDARFRPESVRDEDDNGVSEWLYDLANHRTNATLGNGIESVFTYDLNNRITQIQHADGVDGPLDAERG